MFHLIRSIYPFYTEEQTRSSFYASNPPSYALHFSLPAHASYMFRNNKEADSHMSLPPPIFIINLLALLKQLPYLFAPMEAQHLYDRSVRKQLFACR